MQYIKQNLVVKENTIMNFVQFMTDLDTDTSKLNRISTS